ncbi:MAG: hypothetical protein ACXVKN_01315 [Acidimicrobiia bacterium]
MITTLTTTRTLHLVDIENLVGDPHATKAAALDARTRYVDLAGYVDGDHVVVAANPGLMAQIAFDLPVPCSPHAARGENGADLILLAQAEPGFVADRYDRLVVGSDDAAFTDTALAVRDRGIPVVVVSRAATLLGEGLGIRLLTEPMTLAA